MDRLHALVERVRRDSAPDARSHIFEVAVETRGEEIALVGATTLPDAADSLLAQAASIHPAVVRDEIVRLPDPALGAERAAIVRAACVPLYAQPRLPAPQISELVTGMRADVLARQASWLRVRCQDGYLGWVHTGYVLTGTDSWAAAWCDEVVRSGAISLGVELADAQGRLSARLPWGARVVREGEHLVLPDGRRGVAVGGEVIDLQCAGERFPQTRDAIVGTALRWLGVPYLWGGITPAGADCSGFVQAVLGMHGIALPRDSDMQAAAGTPVATDDVLPADLLFFAENGKRVTHVALSLGGTHIVHAALGNGGVAVDDLTEDAPLPRRLRDSLVAVRRILPD